MNIGKAKGEIYNTLNKQNNEFQNKISNIEDKINQVVKLANGAMDQANQN